MTGRPILVETSLPRIAAAWSYVNLIISQIEDTPLSREGNDWPG